MKIILIDGNNFLYAAQHSGRKLTSGDMEVTAIFGFLGILRVVCLKFPGYTPVVLWDSSPSWRMDIYPDYKGNRKVNPTLIAAGEALRPQRPIIKSLLKDMGVKQYSAPRYEADDLAADLSRKISDRGGKVVLVTRDADWQQLVNDDVIWYDHKNDKIISLDNFEVETGYKTPHRFVHGKAIHGDDSDNIPGVGGLGPGAATLILSEYVCLEECFMDWDNKKKTVIKNTPWSRYASKIEKAMTSPATLEKYNLNLQLMNLNRLYEGITYQSDSRYDASRVKEQFGKLGFHSLLRKYDQWIKPIIGGK